VKLVKIELDFCSDILMIFLIKMGEICASFLQRYFAGFIDKNGLKSGLIFVALFCWFY
jgi:hypothetical protein